MRDPDAEITGGEAAKLLCVTRQQISNLARSGKLPGRQVLGRYWVFKRRDVQAYNTTVAVGQFVGPCGACNASASLALDAVVARMTSASCAPLAAASTTPMPPAAAAPPAPSTGSTQRPGPRPPFLTVASDCLCPRYCQKGMRQQR